MRTSTKAKLFVSTVICLLPIALGVILYRQLPEMLPIHWDLNGTVDRTVSKPIGVFGIPLFISVINAINILFITSDPKREKHSTLLRRVAIWSVPALSIIIIPVTFLIALGRDISISFIGTLMVSLLLILVGNYLPKTQQNYTIGIKLPWTLDNVDNWDKTHRLAGVIFIIGGIALFLSSFIQNTSIHTSVILTVIILLAALPTIYSFLLYKKSEN